MAKNDTEVLKMLRVVVNSQSAAKQELLTEIKKVREEVKGNRERINQVEENLVNRLNAQGSQLAYLDDDAPTGEEFRNLEGRVDKLEKRLASA